MKLKKRIELLKQEIELLRQIKELREQIASAPVVPGTPYPVVSPENGYEKAPWWMNPNTPPLQPTWNTGTATITSVWDPKTLVGAPEPVTTVAHTGDADGFTVARGAGLF